MLACYPEGRMHNSFHAAAHEKVLSQARKFPYPETRSAEDDSCNLGLILILRDTKDERGGGEDKFSNFDFPAIDYKKFNINANKKKTR